MKLVILPGDGIGPEITRATVDVLRRADAVFGLGLETEEHEIGLARLATVPAQRPGLQRRQNRRQPLGPLGMAGTGAVGDHVRMGEQRGGHGAMIGADSPPCRVPREGRMRPPCPRF